MEIIRVQFLPGEQAIFLQQIIQISGLSTKELALLVGVHPRSFIDWKREKLRMTLSAVDLFSSKFNINLPESKEIMAQRWKEAQKRANIIGGRARFEKHGIFATQEGRSRGGKWASMILRQKGIFPSQKQFLLPKFFDVALAEYIGIMLGDGGITPAQTTITLNSVADKEYIAYVMQLSKKLFGLSPKLYQRKNENTTILYYNGVLLVQYLVQLGLRTGNKVRQQVDVPNWVKSNQHYKIACLRGLMDTDGGIFLHRYKVKGREYLYKKISFSNRSIPLLMFVKEALEELGFSAKIIDKVENKKVWLYNAQEVEQYLIVVGTHNPRLLKYSN